MLRDKLGRFRSSRFIAIGLVLGMVALFLIAGVKALADQFTNTTTFQVQERIVEVDNLSGKIEELENELLSKLEKCESGGFSEEDAPIVFDSNNRASIGVFQFQKRTVVHYMKTLYGKDITQKEAVEIAIDAEKSRELARDIVFSDAGFVDWKACDRKLGLTSELAFINKLR